MRAPTHLRDITTLAKYRNARAVVVVCQDDPVSPSWTARVDELGAALVIEQQDGPVSERLGRPMVVVCDEYLEIAWTSSAANLTGIERALEDIALTAGRCPGAGEEAGDAWQ